MIIAKNGTQYNEITNEIIKAHATYVNSPFVKVTRALNYRDVNGHKILVDDFTPEELKAGLAEIAKIADAQTRELYINKFFSRNKSEAQQIITRTLTNKDTYNKTEVNNLVNAKANANATVNLTGNQNIAGVKTFSSPIVVPNGTANNHAVNLAQLNTKANQVTTYNKSEVDSRVNGRATWEYSYPRTETYTKTEVNNLVNSKANQANTYTKAEVDDRVNVKANWNAVVTLSGNQTINGVKTFTSPVIVHNATADNHAVNLYQLKSKADVNYVKKRGGFVNVNFNLAGGQGILIDLNLGINFNVIIQSGVSANMRVVNAASNIGQSGEIYVANGAGVNGFSAPFNFRVLQSGFGANEVFSYLVVSPTLVRITRS